jgi:hypothetical protein
MRYVPFFVLVEVASKLINALQYYVGQPIVYNSVLGSAAFVLASLEYERLEVNANGEVADE